MKINTLEEFDNKIGNFTKACVETYEDMINLKKSNKRVFDIVCGKEKYEMLTVDYNSYLQSYINLLFYTGNDLELKGEFKPFEIVGTETKGNCCILDIDWQLLYAHLCSIHTILLAFEMREIDRDKLLKLLMKPYWESDYKEKANYFIENENISSDLKKQCIEGLFRRVEIIQANMCFLAELANLDKEKIIYEPWHLDKIKKLYIPNEDNFEGFLDRIKELVKE